MLFTDFRQYGEQGDRSIIVPTILGAVFKERCDASQFPFSWKTATHYRQINQPRQWLYKTGETSFKTFTLISSAPVAFDDDKLYIRSEVANLSKILNGPQGNVV